MILIVLKFLTPRGFRGLTFFPFVILADAADKKNQVLINHEKIHIRQQLELLILPFYLWYLIEFFVLWIKYKDKNKAYKNIVFEREAYDFETNLYYLKNRKSWSFWKFYDTKSK